MHKILVVEDDVDINGLLKRILHHAGYHTIQAYSGSEAKLLIDKEMPDLILLDLMLPGVTGEEVLAYIRQQSAGVPVLILSAKNALGDRVSLLRNGADDYITKPFEPEEVLARIEANLRRSMHIDMPQQVLIHKNLQLYPTSRRVMLKEKELNLTVHEFDILYLLMKHPDKVYSREHLYEEVWSEGYYGENNTVNVHVSNIRKKLKEIDSEEDYIQTVYGIGFKLVHSL